MHKDIKMMNLALSGGGIKGIAYAGVLDVAEREGIKWGNIAGVSAGALVGAYSSAGFSARELKGMLDDFDFSKIEIGKIEKKVAAVSHYSEFLQSYRGQVRDEDTIMEIFLRSPVFSSSRGTNSAAAEVCGLRGGFFENIITLSKEGCLCDGDYLEEWVYKMLAKKGVKTFADLRGGIADRKNPRGYKVRMTAVDSIRAKVVVLPDDIGFYGIDPDKLEVCRAVRMSTCVPFAFKPVEIKKTEHTGTKTYYIVDGGVLDNFPSWLLDCKDINKIAGFRLVGNEKKKIISMDTPLNIMKALINHVHDSGVEKELPKLKYMGDINTADVSFLDFNLDQEDKLYLYNSGVKTASKLLKGLNKGYQDSKHSLLSIWNEIKNK